MTSRLENISEEWIVLINQQSSYDSLIKIRDQVRNILKSQMDRQTKAYLYDAINRRKYALNNGD